MTITAPPARIEQTNPLLSEIRACSAKSFTGSISATWQGNEVLVWLEDGALVAVHSPSYKAPLAELVDRLTGRRPANPANPLFEAFQNGWMSADQVDSAVRDFAYGLLASALTWHKPKIRLNRKVRVDHEKFLPGQQAPWQRVVTDVTSRVDELVSSWAVITDALGAVGMEPRPASHACQRLVITVPSHPLLRTGLPVDAAARVLGTTRQVLLRETARVILLGRETPEFSVATAVEPGPGDGVLVPEALEAADGQWASVEAAAQVDVRAVDLGSEPSTDSVGSDPVGFLSSFGSDDPFAGAALDAAGLWPARSDAPEEAGTPAPWTPTGTEGLESPPAENAADVEQVQEALDEQPASAPEPSLPSFDAVMGLNPLDAWVSAAGDDDERDARADVVKLAAQAAVEEARAKLHQVEQAFATLRSHGERLAAAAESLPAAQSAVEVAELAAGEARARVDEAARAAQSDRERCLQADERAVASGQAAEAAAAAMDAARRAYDDAVEQARDLADAAARDQRDAQSARRAMDEGPGAALRAAQADLDRLTGEQVEPARTALAQAQQQRSALEQVAGAAQQDLEAAGVAARAALRVLATDWPTQPDGADEVSRRLEALSQQVNVYYQWVDDVLARRAPAHVAVPAAEPAKDEIGDDDLLAIDEMTAPVVPTQAATSPTEDWREPAAELDGQRWPQLS